MFFVTKRWHHWVDNCAWKLRNYWVLSSLLQENLINAMSGHDLFMRIQFLSSHQARLHNFQITNCQPMDINVFAIKTTYHDIFNKDSKTDNVEFIGLIGYSAWIYNAIDCARPKGHCATIALKYQDTYPTTQKYRYYWLRNFINIPLIWNFDVKNSASARFCNMSIQTSHTRHESNIMHKNDVNKIITVIPYKCKPKKCKLECKRYCPINQNGKKCIDVRRSSKSAFVDEKLCTLESLLFVRLSFC